MIFTFLTKKSCGDHSFFHDGASDFLDNAEDDKTVIDRFESTSRQKSGRENHEAVIIVKLLFNVGKNVFYSIYFC